MIFGNPYVSTIYAIGFANNELTGGTLTSAGGIDTLTVPILVESPIVVDGNTVLQRYTGQLVATAAVPEPSSMILACMAGMGLAAALVRGQSRTYLPRRSESATFS